MKQLKIVNLNKQIGLSSNRSMLKMIDSDNVLETLKRYKSPDRDQEN